MDKGILIQSIRTKTKAFSLFFTSAGAEFGGDNWVSPRRLSIPVILFCTGGSFLRGAGAVHRGTSFGSGRSFCRPSKIPRKFRSSYWREFSS
jgi:hypothetical protein